MPLRGKLYSYRPSQFFYISTRPNSCVLPNLSFLINIIIRKITNTQIHAQQTQIHTHTHPHTNPKHTHKHIITHCILFFLHTNVLQKIKIYYKNLLPQYHFQKLYYQIWYIIYKFDISRSYFCFLENWTGLPGNWKYKSIYYKDCKQPLKKYTIKVEEWITRTKHLDPPYSARAGAQPSLSKNIAWIHGFRSDALKVWRIYYKLWFPMRPQKSKNPYSLFFLLDIAEQRNQPLFFVFWEWGSDKSTMAHNDSCSTKHKSE